MLIPSEASRTRRRLAAPPPVVIPNPAAPFVDVPAREIVEPKKAVAITALFGPEKVGEGSAVRLLTIPPRRSPQARVVIPSVSEQSLRHLAFGVLSNPKRRLRPKVMDIRSFRAATRPSRRFSGLKKLVRDLLRELTGEQPVAP
jgi:hypothetical protein